MARIQTELRRILIGLTNQTYRSMILSLQKWLGETIRDAFFVLSSAYAISHFILCCGETEEPKVLSSASLLPFLLDGLNLAGKEVGQVQRLVQRC